MFDLCGFVMDLDFFNGRYPDNLMIFVIVHLKMRNYFTKNDFVWKKCNHIDSRGIYLRIFNTNTRTIASTD